jgi:uncharacterized membrane protein YGL010W
MGKTADQWFAEYERSHSHALNKWFHWICVPATTVSLLGLLWSLPMPASWGRISEFVNPATLAVAAALVFYLKISPSLAIGMAVFAAIALTMISGYQRLGWMPLWRPSLTIFVAAGILQVVGHAIEGKRPSIFDDLRYVLIGPLWVFRSVYREAGIRY